MRSIQDEEMCRRWMVGVLERVWRWRLGARVVCAAAVIAGVVFHVAVLSGCGTHRFDHFHSEENLKKARAASDAFDAVRSERAGLPSLMLANLEAQQTLRRTVSEEAVRFFDLADVQIAADVTWSDLRDELLSDLGARWDDLAFILDLMVQIGEDREIAKTEKDRLLRNVTILAVTAAKIRGLEQEEKNRSFEPLWHDLIEAPLDQFYSQQIADRNGDPSILYRRYPPPYERIGSVDLTSIPDDLAVQKYAPEDVKRVLQFAPLSVGKAAGLEDDRRAEEFGRELLQPAADPEAAIRSVELRPRWGFVDRAIKTRLGYLADCLKAYEVLIKGERAKIALLSEAQRRLLKKAKVELSGGGGDGDAAEEPPVGLSEALELLQGLQEGISEYWGNTEKRRQYREHASHLQALLLEAAAGTGDPASVYSLVPLAGEGLSPGDLAQLSEYVRHLTDVVESQDAALEELRTALKRSEADGAKTPETEAAFAFVDAFDELKLLLSDVDEQEIEEVLEKALDATGQLELELDVRSASEVLERTAALKEPLRSIALENGLTAGGVESLVGILAGPEVVARLDSSIANVVSAEQLRHLRSILSDVVREDAESTNRVVDMLVAVQGLHLRLREESVRHHLALSVIAKAEVERWKTVKVLLDEMTEDFQPSGGRVFGVPAPDCKIAANSAPGDEAATRDEPGDEAATRDEPGDEVATLAAPGDEGATLAAPGDGAATRDEPGDEVATLAAPGDEAATPAAPGDEGVAQSASSRPPLGTPEWPDIDLDQHVTSSIRLMAEYAHWYQTNSPAQNDLDGACTRKGSERLQHAVALLQGYVLLTTVNRRAAAENSINLIGEVQEHAVQVDNIVVASTETTLRYELDSLVAFHATGVTDEDLQLLTGLVQQGLLVWIGSGV